MRRPKTGGRIERLVVLPVPRAELWAAISEPEQLGAWFGAEVQLDAVPGGRAAFRWADGTERGALVEEVEPPRRLAFRWLPFERLADGSMVRREVTRVELILDDAEGETRLTVVETALFGTGRAGAEVFGPRAPGTPRAMVVA